MHAYPVPPLVIEMRMTCIFPSFWNFSIASVRCLPLISPSILVKVMDSDFSALSMRLRVVVQYENTTLYFWVNTVSCSTTYVADSGLYRPLFSPFRVVQALKQRTQLCRSLGRAHFDISSL
jgi:hypothetical protein